MGGVNEETEDEHYHAVKKKKQDIKSKIMTSVLLMRCLQNATCTFVTADI